MPAVGAIPITEFYELILSKKGFNYKILLVLTPVLLLVGIFGFAVPSESAAAGGSAATHNIFYIAAGAVGLILLVLRKENYVRAFHAGFGLICLYLAAAGFAGLFPAPYFRLTPAHDFLHVLVGTGLAAAALYGWLRRV